MPKNSSYVQSLTDDKIREYLKFPLKLDRRNRLETIRNTIDATRQFVISFFETPVNSRLMESRLGTQVHRFIGYPLTDDVKRTIQETVEEEIRRNFRILKILDIKVVESSNRSHGFRLEMRLDYKMNLREDYLFDLDSDISLIDIQIDIV